MPYDKAGKGTFRPEGKRDPRTFTYQIDKWVKRGETKQRSGKRIKESELPQVEYMIVGSAPEDEPDNVTYDTVYGPFDDWEFLEDFLAYDFGDEGSLLQVAAS